MKALNDGPWKTQVKCSRLDFVWHGRPVELHCSRFPSQCTHRREMVQIKRLSYAPPRNWDASGAGKLSAWLALILWFSSVNKAVHLMEHVRLLQDSGAGPLLWLDSCQPLRAQRACDSSMCCRGLQSRRAVWGKCWFPKQLRSFSLD